MFEKASRLKLRFNSIKGSLTAEDLWDLPLISISSVCLDDLAKEYNRQLKESEEESFVTKKNPVTGLINLKFSIVKHIISVRLAEAEIKENAAAIRAKKEKIFGIIEDKEDEKLKNTSVAKLRKMVEEL